MPTGYTHGLTEETSFREFALTCARNFGALITMRDEPMDAPIPDEFSPDDYHVKGEREAMLEVEKYQAMTVSEARIELEKARLEAEQEALARKVEVDTTRRAYERMLEFVREWTPPTPDHENMKSFMASQLLESIRFDCGGTYYVDRMMDLKATTPEKYLSSRLDQAKQSLAYHRAEHDKAVERARARTAWIKALKGSLS